MVRVILLIGNDGISVHAMTFSHHFVPDL